MGKMPILRDTNNTVNPNFNNSLNPVNNIGNPIDDDMGKMPILRGTIATNLTPYEENRYLLGCRNDRCLWER
ncbi:MAG: hypothetical protein ACKO5Q_29660, partial [Microcystaceae cyanobacterium]